MSSINFTRKEAQYLMAKTGADDFNEALEIFSKLIQAEHINPEKMPEYVKKLMEKDGIE